MKIRPCSSAARSFTLIELMIALVIVGVLVTMGIPAYRNFVENGRTQTCATNLEAHKAAFEIYIAEHNVVPGTLSDLSPEEVDKAFARAIRSKGLAVRWVAFLDRWQARNFAFASLIEEIGKGNMKLLTCPSDMRASPTKISYGINTAVAGLTKEEYLNLPANTVVIADSNSAVFSDVPSAASERHRHVRAFNSDTFANAVTKGGWVKKHGAGAGCNSCSNSEPKDRHPSRKDVQDAIECWKRCF